jgi:hypothetical protein
MAKPQPPQKRKPSGFSSPQLGQVSMGEAYDAGRRMCEQSSRRPLCGRDQPVADAPHIEDEGGIARLPELAAEAAGV